MKEIHLKECKNENFSGIQFKSFHRNRLFAYTRCFDSKLISVDEVPNVTNYITIMKAFVS